VPAPSATAARGPSWRELATGGRYVEALATVGADFDALCIQSSAADVIVLGDVARLAGDAPRARSAYGQVRARFGGTREASIAAFSAGRMAAQEGHGPEAARWFETYLREAADGSLAREALGRAMEAREREGEHGAAKAHAVRYLATYPEGPHAPLARKIGAE